MKMGRHKEHWIHACLFACAAFSFVVTGGIIWVLVSESVPFFRTVPLIDFLTDRQWTPLFSPQHFGIAPLLCGTFLIALVAALLAVPMGILSAIYLIEFASQRVRRILKPVLEILAGVPTIVYGYFALTYVTPLLMRILPATQIFNALSAGLVVGIMILPMIASLSDDALRAVPLSLRTAGFSLGATSYEVAARIVTPAAFSGIMASMILALSRALGETMIVAMAAGSTPKLTFNVLSSIQTMTGYIVQVSMGDTPAGSLEYQTLFAVGLLLFLITLLLNLSAQKILRRFREHYE